MTSELKQINAELLAALKEILSADEAYEFAADDTQEKIDTAIVWSAAHDKALAAIAKAEAYAARVPEGE